MKKYLQMPFSTREYMLSQDFELFYYNDKHIIPLKEHSHNYYEFYFFLGGNVSITIKKQEFLLEKGDMILLPPGIKHYITIHDPNVAYQRFVFWITSEFADELQKIFSEEVLSKVSEVTFPILYQDKDFLYNFNCKITEQVNALKKVDFPAILAEDGIFIRPNLPRWLQRGVVYRDRGVCQDCGVNLESAWSTMAIENFDHIIPLSKGGTNDPTNIQILCETCNNKKSNNSSSYKNSVLPFWSSD